MSDDDIPPPLSPKPKGGKPDDLMLPWRLADAPRLQLEFLARSEALNEKDRESVRAWLNSYNVYIAQWLYAEYGADAVREANGISRATAQRMNENQSTAREQAERDLFRKLEEDFRSE